MAFACSEFGCGEISMIIIRHVLIICLLLVSVQVMAKEPSFGPAISNYGPTFPIDDRDVTLRENFIYRAVFDLAAYPGDSTATNRKLVSVARYMNMHTRNAVPIDKMDIAVVLHGKALMSALSHEAYKIRFNTENPNYELLMKLQEAGVRFYACGQSMAFGGISKSELASPIEVALSAMTMLTVLQSDGYALLP
jgi:intracellular sulfur oxidation DsrE/DsrF family protein